MRSYLGNEINNDPEQPVTSPYHSSTSKLNGPHYFYKTKLCPFLLYGKCIKGNECTFAHSNIELQNAPDLKKTKLCTNYLSGYCSRGNSCLFAHSQSELRQPPDFYKTGLCHPFMNGKKCVYGSKCRFAHGASELRPKPHENPSIPYQLSMYNKSTSDNLPSFVNASQLSDSAPYVKPNIMNFQTLEEQLNYLHSTTLPTTTDQPSALYDGFFSLNQNTGNEKETPYGYHFSGNPSQTTSMKPFFQNKYGSGGL